jgi:hypothetical protein
MAWRLTIKGGYTSATAQTLTNIHNDLQAQGFIPIGSPSFTTWANGVAAAVLYTTCGVLCLGKNGRMLIDAFIQGDEATNVFEDIIKTRLGLTNETIVRDRANLD